MVFLHQQPFTLLQLPGGAWTSPSLTASGSSDEIDQLLRRKWLSWRGGVVLPHTSPLSNPDLVLWPTPGWEIHLRFGDGIWGDTLARHDAIQSTLPNSHLLWDNWSVSSGQDWTETPGASPKLTKLVRAEISWVTLHFFRKQICCNSGKAPGSTWVGNPLYVRALPWQSPYGFLHHSQQETERHFSHGQHTLQGHPHP